MQQLKCLGIGCSPRIQGNTSLLLANAMQGAAEAGAKCETIYLRDYKFSPCIACGGCNQAGQCVLKDEMQMIYRQLLDADRIILAAPIFSMGMNALGKGFIDRGQRFWATKYILNQAVAPRPDGPARLGLFLSAAGTDLPGVFDCAIRGVKYYYKMADIKYLKEFCYSKVDAKGEILNHPNALQDVYQAGQDLILAH
ncbi:MAG: flavodoxin family protein [Peptococcaceae bacterium]|nr:flavodoxin family protein [Peptococcaceae bacterium]